MVTEAEVEDPVVEVLEADGKERMNQMKKVFLIVISLLLLTAGCVNDEKLIDNNSDKMIVYASFYPLYFLAEEIGGDNIDLRIIIPNGVDSHDYEPSMNQLKDVDKAQVFIYNGANFESWTDKLIGNVVDEDTTINASNSVDLIMNNGSPDPHIWLDPNNMIEIGEDIKDRFIELDGRNKEYYENNYEELYRKLKELDDRFLNELSVKKNGSIIVSHAAFAYMSERYGFGQIPVAGVSPDQEPSPRTIANIIDIAKEEGHEYIFLETVASPKTVNVIAEETNLITITLNPIEGLTEEEQKNGEDYISIMEDNLENLKKALVK